MPTMQVILPRMTEICSAGRIRELDPRILRRRSLPAIAEHYGAAQDPFQVRYIRNWPRPQLEAVRGLLLHAAREGVPIRFDWEECETTDVLIGGSKSEISVIFRSPVPKRRAPARAR
jgi:hypothetical protein